MELKAATEPCVHCWNEAEMHQATTSNDVWKDECGYCFATNEYPGGVLVSLKTFVGMCGDHVAGYHTHSTKQCPIYLRIIKKEAPKEEIKDVNQLGLAPPPIYIGSVVCCECQIEFPEGEFPGVTGRYCQSIMNAISPKVQDKIAHDSQFSHLKLCPHGDTIVQSKDGLPSGGAPTSSSKCSSCDHNVNNWLCLTCGAIGCPRKEAGGQEHAVLHFLITNHPLVVKLGTVTPGGADIHCYACDDEVRINKLDMYLRTFGIDMNTSVKTSKTLGEMMYDVNSQFDWNKICEQGKDLIPCYGPGFTGLKNFGNSCYFASVVQVLFAMPEYFARYAITNHREMCRNPQPNTCYDCQIEKLAVGMTSGEHADADQPYKLGITPQVFKKLISKGHRDFSTGEQQDAHEFFVYLLEQMSRKEAVSNDQLGDPGELFEFLSETRKQCSKCGRVQYTRNKERCLSLNIPVVPQEGPVDETGKPLKLTNEQIEAMRPHASFNQCISAYLFPDTCDCRCAECGQAALYQTTYRMATFPEVLAVHVRREYMCKKTFTAKKLDVYVDVDDEINIERVRGSGVQPGETLFTVETGGSAPAGGGSTFQVDELAYVQVMSVGIEDERTIKWALENTSNNAERAIDWIFSHPEGPPSAVTVKPKEPEVKNDGPAQYELFAMISHIGASALTGHYLCHIKKEGQWFIFDDEKVAVSQDPPKRMASIYFYRRKAE